MSALTAHNIDVNLGLVTYGDLSKLPPHSNEGGDTVPTKIVGFPLDVDQFKSEVGDIRLTNGVDWKESGLEGLMEAHEISNFRPDATKNYILVTDAFVHEKQALIDKNHNNIDDPEEIAESIKYSKFTINGVIDELKDEAKITVITNEYANNGQLAPLHEQTDGMFLNIEGMFGEQLLALAEKITNESGGSFTEETLDPLTIQLGANEGQNLKTPLYDHRDFRSFLKDIALSPYSSAMEALQRVDNIIAKINDRRAEYGAYTNRLEHAYNVEVNTSENLAKAESMLRDTDIAKETMSLKKEQVLLQASQAMMAQINQMSQGILQLLG